MQDTAQASRDRVDLAERRIAVTGATGFLGRYLCAALQDRGAQVVGVVRSPARGVDLADRGVELRTADLADAAALQEAVQRVDAIVANAGLIFSRQSSDFVRVNVEGMENLIQAAAAANVRRLIVVSTVSIYRHNGQNNDEGAPQVPYTDATIQSQPYAATKAQGEALAWQAAEKHGLEVTAVRPGYLYGRGAHVIKTFRNWLAGPVALIPCCRRIPLAYAADVAEAVSRCLERPVSIGQAYNLTGREDLSWRDFANSWAAAGGPTARIKVPVPRVAQHRYDTSRAVSDLEWTNTSFVDALSEVLQPSDAQLR